MQPVTRNRKYPKGLNHVSCVIWSCIVACNLLHEIGNAGKGLNNVPCVVRSWIVACNLLHEKTRSKITALHSVPRWNHSCIKMHATHEIMNTRKRLNNVLCVVRSCNKLHATGNYARDVSVVQQNARHNMEKNAPLRKCKTM